MRWLLLKDLQILRRSPLLVALLVLYPIVVALLVGAALSSGPSKPKVAFANLVPPDEAKIELGGERLDATTYAAELFEAVDPIRVDSREQAIEKVRSGEALGALVIPPDVIERLQGTLALGGGDPPTVEVYYSAENPLKRRYVEATIDATLADANKALSDEVFKEAARYLNLIVVGGSLTLPLVGDVDILGLRERADDHRRRDRAACPRIRAPAWRCSRSSRFARLAADNLDVSKPILASIGTPVAVDKKVISGSNSSLDVFGVEVAVVISLMFVGSCWPPGCWRSNARSTRSAGWCAGSSPEPALLAEKIWPRGPVRLVARGGDAGTARRVPGPRLEPSAALAARARVRGARVRRPRRRDRRADARGPRRLAARVHARAAVAALALVPSGAVDETLYDVIRIVSAAFPFKPALSALDAALSGGELLAPLAHLAALTVGFALIAGWRCAASPERRAPARPPSSLAIRWASKLQACSPPPACAACAKPACCAAWCGRPSSPPRISSTRCSSATASTAGFRSRACPGSITSRSRPRSRRPGRPPRSGSPPCCSSACRPPRTRRARAHGTTRASSSSRRARSRPPIPTCS